MDREAVEQEVPERLTLLVVEMEAGAAEAEPVTAVQEELLVEVEAGELVALVRQGVAAQAPAAKSASGPGSFSKV